MTLAIPVITTNQLAPSRLKSRKSFLHEVQPLSQPPQTARLTLWEEQRSAKQHLAKLPIPTSEQLAPGHKSEWKLWKSLNRLRTGMGRSKTNMSKWGYADTADTACECGTSEQTMQHLLRCPLLENECSLEDLATANEKALHCARAWPNIWLNSEMMDTKEEERNNVYDYTVCIKKWYNQKKTILDMNFAKKVKCSKRNTCSFCCFLTHLFCFCTSRVGHVLYDEANYRLGHFLYSS